MALPNGTPATLPENLRGALVRLERADGTTRYARVTRVWRHIKIGHPRDMDFSRLALTSVGVEEMHPLYAIGSVRRPVLRSRATGEVIHLTDRSARG